MFFFFFCILLVKVKKHDCNRIKQVYLWKNYKWFTTVCIWTHLIMTFNLLLLLLLLWVNNYLTAFCFNSLLCVFNMHGLLSNPASTWNKSLMPHWEATQCVPGGIGSAHVTRGVARSDGTGAPRARRGGRGGSSTNNHTDFHPLSWCSLSTFKCLLLLEEHLCSRC